MTKYKLENFKSWVEAKGNELKDYSWPNYWSYFPQNLNNWETILQGEGKLPCSTIQKPVQDIILQWKNEIDNQQNSNESKIIELNQEIISLKQENEKFRNHELNDNEKKIIAVFPRALAASGVGLDFRLTSVKRALEQLKKNDLSIQATPNLSAQGISLSECLAANLAEIIWIGNFYFSKESDWEETREELEERIRELETQNQQLSNLISPNQPYNFTQLHQELKRLKIQDLTLQIPLKKQELEQNTNNLKNNFNNSGKYLLEKLLKKQNKLLLNNENNSEKLEEMKQTLSGDLENQEQLQVLLNQQKELFNLGKHLDSLQNEQVAQVIHNPSRNN